MIMFHISVIHDINIRRTYKHKNRKVKQTLMCMLAQLHLTSDPVDCEPTSSLSMDISGKNTGVT